MADSHEGGGNVYKGGADLKTGLFNLHHRSRPCFCSPIGAGEHRIGP